jgi:hypothetical protein
MSNYETCGERLRHYGRKCEQHLTRVRLSHALSLTAVEGVTRTDDLALEELVRGSFDESPPDMLGGKLRWGLNELHLGALKADFELFLNRILTEVWKADFLRLAIERTPKKNIRLKELAAAVAGGASGRECVVEAVVPKHGLKELAEAIYKTTDIDLSENLPEYDFSRWSQVCVAFQVRHLIEHSDGKADSRFRNEVKKFWEHSTWGKRHPELDKVDRLRVDAADVWSSYAAMRDAARLLANALLKWNAARRTGLSSVDGRTSA